MKIHVLSYLNQDVKVNLVCYDNIIHELDWYFKNPQPLTQNRTVDLNPEGLCIQQNTEQYLINVWKRNQNGKPDSYLIIDINGQVIEKKEDSFRFQTPLSVFEENVFQLDLYPNNKWDTRRIALLTGILFISLIGIFLLGLIGYGVYKKYNVSK